MLTLKLTQDEFNKFVPTDEKAEHFFSFIGKKSLKLQEMKDLLTERIQIKLELGDSAPIHSGLQIVEYETQYLIWYNSMERVWYGSKLMGEGLEIFGTPVYKAKTKSDLIEKMFMMKFALRKDD